MKEYDDPLALELHTSREVTALLISLGVGVQAMEGDNRLAGAQAAANLQIRVASQDAQEVAKAVDEHLDGGLWIKDGEEEQISGQAAVGQLSSQDEQDPDEVTKGQL